MSDHFLPYLQAAGGLSGVSLLLLLAGCVLVAATALYLGVASLVVALRLWMRDRNLASGLLRETGSVLGQG